ncbi:retinol dehydrogenase 14-like [Mizuhopecten yessoensis]|uniref:Retinol dehydrogenase 14 n=1 Tax=Mizuhopecten yessoensis TaxID=6573 RepID=A0A210QLE1_MIZYE|nr:retinol dehydrogenase 14-like [Mizuhopecten yessoensis]OWF49544.1 Retinol dehydrogenase 14 [Mizuhopecten yessoensis]
MWWVWWWLLAVVGIVAVVIKIYMEMIKGKCTSKADLTGKTAIVTGANSGIGFATAEDFARRNCRVIMACRSLERGENACTKIIEKTGNINVVVRKLDLGYMASVREFVDKILKEEPRLDILINNAAAAGTKRKITSEALEYTLATNHLGPFLLTNLLLDLLKKSGPGRIVMVSSLVNIMGKINFNDMTWIRKFETGEPYFDTKFANILFTKELSRRLQDSEVVINCLHPGTVRTSLLRHVPQPFKILIDLLGMVYFKSQEEGAQTTIHCAVCDATKGVSGCYFIDCKVQDHSWYINKKAYDEGLAKKLWEVSEQMTGLTTS